MTLVLTLLTTAHTTAKAGIIYRVCISGQSDCTTTGLDPEDNQHTLQKESAIKLTTMVPIAIQEDSFLRNLCDNGGKHTFSRTFVMACGIIGATTPVLLISQRLIHFHPPYMNWYFTHMCTG